MNNQTRVLRQIIKFNFRIVIPARRGSGPSNRQFPFEAKEFAKLKKTKARSVLAL